MVLCVCPNPAIDKFIDIDNFIIGKVNRISEERSYPGGKGVHVALGVRELGEEVALLAFWGGPTGQWVKQECESRGIACYGPDIESWTRTCLTIRSNNGFDETELLGAGTIIDQHDYSAFLTVYEQLLKDAEVISMNGSWPKNNVQADYGHLITLASESSKKTFLDCSGSALPKALKKKPFGVHINHLEGYDLFKTNDPMALSKSIGESSEQVAITYGADGLYLSNGESLVHALSSVEKVISAVGSGDCLVAGLVVAYCRAYDLIETAKLAASCGAANCIRAELGMFYKKDVDRLVESCEIRTM